MISKTTILVFALATVSFAAVSQHDHSSHGDKKEMSNKKEPIFKDLAMGTAYNHYIHLKEALVASQPNEAREAAVKLQESLATSEGGAAAEAESGKVALASNLVGQRKAFASLSREMTALVKASTLTMGEIYLEYCPMANENTGAYWLSSEKEIKNPYFGDKMLKCGSVKETIN